MNFFWKKEFTDDTTDNAELNPEVHIGKLKFGGLYCYDCGIILNVLGTPLMHQKEVTFENGTSMKNHQFEQCPRCKQKMVEPGVQTGVSTCDSFTWTGMFQKKKIESLKKEKQKMIYDSEGNEYTPKQFLNAIKSSVVDFQSYMEFR